MQRYGCQKQWWKSASNSILNTQRPFQWAHNSPSKDKFKVENFLSNKIGEHFSPGTRKISGICLKLIIRILGWDFSLRSVNTGHLLSAWNNNGKKNIVCTSLSSKLYYLHYFRSFMMLHSIIVKKRVCRTKLTTTPSRSPWITIWRACWNLSLNLIKQKSFIKIY